VKRKSWLFSYLVILAIAVLIAIVVKFVLPGVLKHKILEGVRESCPDCVAYFQKVDISLAHPGLLVFHDVRFTAGQGGRSLVEARAKELSVDISFSKSSLLGSSQHRLEIQNVSGEGVEVIYADGDAPEEKKLSPESSDKMLFAIHETKMNDALFRYVHTKKKVTSILHIHDIDGTLGLVGNTPEALDTVSTARLTGQIEKSGRGELHVAALLRPGPWHVDVALDIADQNLSDLNGFFSKSDGVELQGHMLKASAQIVVRDEVSKAHVSAVYKDADYKENVTKDRSAIEATFSNLGAQLIMTKSNVDFPPEKQAADVEVKRDAGEPLVHYLLRSAKLGLLEVTKTKK